MLNVMRKHAYSWLVRVILFLIVIVFAFWGLGGGRFFEQVHPVATFNGQEIMASEVDLEADRLRRILQNTYGANAASLLRSMNLRQQALERIIEHRLISNEAQRMGLEINDETLQKNIAENQAFQEDGHFDVARYQEVLRANDL